MDLKEIKLVIRWRWHVDLAQTAFPHRVVWEARERAEMYREAVHREGQKSRVGVEMRL